MLFRSDGKAYAIVTSTHTASLDDDICEVYGGNKDDDDIRKANASLIAAAPDLLEVLHECKSFLETQKEFGLDVPELDHVRAVIAKAKGKVR